MLAKCCLLVVGLHVALGGAIPEISYGAKPDTDFSFTDGLKPSPVFAHPNQLNTPYISSAPKDSADGHYGYGWVVRDQFSGNHFGHQQHTDGPDTRGSYYVFLPDGRKQHVKYYVSGKSGYVADVSYEGRAVHPPPIKYLPYRGFPYHNLRYYHTLPYLTRFSGLSNPIGLPDNSEELGQDLYSEELGHSLHSEYEEPTQMHDDLYSMEENSNNMEHFESSYLS